MQTYTKHFSAQARGLAIAVLSLGSSLVGAGQFDVYKPNAFVGRTVTEAEVFDEAMVKGSSEGVLVGKTATMLQGQFGIKTPVRMKTVKGDVDAKGCQILYTSMWLSDIPAKMVGKDKADYWFVNKMTLCKENKSPVVEVISCEFAGKSCMHS